MTATSLAGRRLHEELESRRGRGGGRAAPSGCRPATPSCFVAPARGGHGAHPSPGPDAHRRSGDPARRVRRRAARRRQPARGRRRPAAGARSGCWPPRCWRSGPSPSSSGAGALLERRPALSRPGHLTGHPPAARQCTAAHSGTVAPAGWSRGGRTRTSERTPDRRVPRTDRARGGPRSAAGRTRAHADRSAAVLRSAERQPPAALRTAARAAALRRDAVRPALRPAVHAATARLPAAGAALLGPAAHADHPRPVLLRRPAAGRRTGRAGRGRRARPPQRPAADRPGRAGRRRAHRRRRRRRRGRPSSTTRPGRGRDGAAAQNVVIQNPETATTATAAAAKAAPSVVTVYVHERLELGQRLRRRPHRRRLRADQQPRRRRGRRRRHGPGPHRRRHPLRRRRSSAPTRPPTSPSLKLDGAEGLTPATFADSDDVQVGDVAVAIGAPLGLSNTVTDGIISATDRAVADRLDAGRRDRDRRAADRRGDQPRQLRRRAGQRRRRGHRHQHRDRDRRLRRRPASQSQSGNIGVGFAIPSNTAQRIAQEIIETGSATRAFLGRERPHRRRRARTPSVGTGAEVVARRARQRRRRRRPPGGRRRHRRRRPAGDHAPPS